MEIFGIGLGELLAIILVMLVIVGPERMIRWAFTLGQYAGKLQQLWRETVKSLQHELDASGAGITIPKEIPTRQTLTRDMDRALRNLYAAPPARRDAEVTEEAEREERAVS